jgi:hypothetical protein
MVNSKIIHIRSQDAIKYDDNSNYISFALSEPIVVSEKQEIIVQVLNCSIPYSFYNVNYINKYLDIKENNDIFTMIFEEGNYSAVQFAHTLENLLNQNSPNNCNYSVSYNKFTNKMIISISTANVMVSFLFLSGENSKYDCQYILGFYKKQDYSFNSLNNLVSDSAVNVSPYEAIYIQSNLGITNQYATNSKNLSNILIKIPITSTPFSYINWENKTENLRYKSYLTTIQTITLSLNDADGDLIDILNANWYMTVMFQIVEKNDYFILPRDDLVKVKILDDQNNENV